MKKKNIPTLFIKAESIPEAHYKAIKSVWENGIEKRTQYDRKENGAYIDPPGKDSQTLIEIDNPFSQPRYPPVSFCERGKYILEILGAKNKLVIPREELLKGIDENNLDTRWPYAYNQRLSAYPTASGEVNQIDKIIERFVDNMDTRRGVATTRAPEIDSYLKEDIPCLGEVHFRSFEGEEGYLLNMTTIWRSRDLFKAWPDNTLALTYFGRKVANKLEERLGKKVVLGKYLDFSNSLHIYGQDFAQIQGDENGKKGFFDVFPDIDSYVERSMDSEMARDYEVIPQMKKLVGESFWNFSEEEKQDINDEISFLEEGNLP